MGINRQFGALFYHSRKGRGMVSPSDWDSPVGVSVGHLAKRGYFGENRASLLDGIADSGAESVALIVTIMQEDFASTRMFQDFAFTVSDRELVSMIEGMQERGIKVMLKPHLENHDSAWRGSIAFPDDGDEHIQGRRTDYWQRWFDNLEGALRHYGRLADRTGCGSFCLGCELKGAESKSEHWQSIIESVREVYDGRLVYNAADASFDGIHQWYYDLDAIGVSFYWPGSEEGGATVEEMKANMRGAIPMFRETAEELEMPIFFAETGCRSVEGGAIEPWAYQPERPYDGQEQANYLQAVLETFTAEPWFDGLFWWKWDENQTRPQYDKPGGDTGFTIQGKPAETVLQDHTNPSI